MGGPTQTSLQQNWEFRPSGSWKLSKVCRGQGGWEQGLSYLQETSLGTGK